IKTKVFGMVFCLEEKQKHFAKIKLLFASKTKYYEDYMVKKQTKVFHHKKIFSSINIGICFLLEDKKCFTIFDF
ncbi:MAG TPA: hypothetical protein PLO05_10650, partial [Bacteroidales bacterium]|nr:hypothetical protein [Bacteroidales bacterium]